LAEVEYRRKSHEGKVRRPFFKGLREVCELVFDCAASANFIRPAFAASVASYLAIRLMLFEL
jgi:hypothetical protein